MFILLSFTVMIEVSWLFSNKILIKLKNSQKNLWKAYKVMLEAFLCQKSSNKW